MTEYSTKSELIRASKREKPMIEHLTPIPTPQVFTPPPIRPSAYYAKCSEMILHQARCGVSRTRLHQIYGKAAIDAVLGPAYQQNIAE